MGSLKTKAYTINGARTVYIFKKRTAVYWVITVLRFAMCTRRSWCYFDQKDTTSSSGLIINLERFIEEKFYCFLPNYTRLARVVVQLILFAQSWLGKKQFKFLAWLNLWGIFIEAEHERVFKYLQQISCSFTYIKTDQIVQYYNLTARKYQHFTLL